jgi:hypothetical protein
MNSIPSATLVLRTYDLTAGSSTNIGTSNAYRTDMTWNNINLRTLLGDMYDKYDSFNLSLKSITSGTSIAASGTTADDKTILINLTGLPFINQTYNQATETNSSSIILSPYIMSSGGPTFTMITNSKQFTFSKNQDICNIRINYTKVLDDATPNGTASYPNYVFIFDIYGIPRDEGNKNNSRMF